MTEPDPVCWVTDCDAANHCDHHEQPVHHCVDSIARIHREEAERHGTQGVRQAGVSDAD